MSVSIPFDNSYARLPGLFHAAVRPTPVAAPRLLRLNRGLALELGLDPAALASAEGVEILAGNRVPEGAEPLALAYAGHQFGGFVPTLGDGRAILLGEVVTPDGRRRDIQLKGSGRTPFSRQGDGRAALGPVLREYLMSEAMAALGVPTTRSLAAVATGQPVFREDALPGAVLTRVASSHIRVGTFQYFAARGETEAVRQLADHAIARHDPDLLGREDRYAAFLQAVADRQADLVAQWLMVGFVHGVMNTDNTAVSGETIDYGPCAFIDAYDPRAVYSSIDRNGRYAFGNQAGIAQWNLARLAECLLPLLADGEEAQMERANGVLARYATRFNDAYLAGLRRKLGLTREMPDDLELAKGLLTRMVEERADYTLTFRALCDAAADPAADAGVRRLFLQPGAYDSWAGQWQTRLAAEGEEAAAGRADAMRRVNPAIIPRNHLVEEAIEAAVERDDLAPFDRLVTALADPFASRPPDDPLTQPRPTTLAPHRTFCGT